MLGLRRNARPLQDTHCLLERQCLCKIRIVCPTATIASTQVPLGRRRHTVCSRETRMSVWRRHTDDPPETYCLKSGDTGPVAGGTLVARKRCTACSQETHCLFAKETLRACRRHIAWSQKTHCVAGETLLARRRHTVCPQEMHCIVTGDTRLVHRRHLLNTMNWPKHRSPNATERQKCRRNLEPYFAECNSPCGLFG